MNNIKPIPPFKGWVIQNFPFIEADFDAITNYQLYSKVVEYLNKVIANENELTTAMNYVLNYFNNLDVQEEINKKLDEMAQDGTLDEMITSYINLKSILSFNNVNEMKNATNLIDGSFAKTYGFYNYNDGGGAYYKIRTVTNADDVDNKFIIALSNNTLIAELIVDDEINVKKIGAVGDGITDDTNTLQDALNYASTHNKILNFGNPSNFYLITSGLIAPSGIAGIIADRWDYSGIIRTNVSNITVLTIKPTMGAIYKNLSIGGIGTVNSNGILYEGHTGINLFEHIRVYNFNGFGIKINAIWDSKLVEISVEKCGNDDNYAFSMLNDGDTCNMSNIDRLQVEQSNNKAICIDADTLSCNFFNIHSERTSNPSAQSYIFGGNSCNYDVMRINVITETDIDCIIFYGTSTTFNNLIIENNIISTVNGYLKGNTFNNSSFDKVKELQDQNTTIIFNNCKINTFNNYVFSQLINCVITNLNSGYIAENSISKVYNSNITNFAKESTQSKILFSECTIANLGVSETKLIKLENSTVNGINDNYYGYSTIEAYNTIFNTNINIDNCTSRFINCKINGNLTRQAGNQLVLLNNTTVTGDVAPEYTQAPTSNGIKGDIHNNLNIQSGNPSGWVFNGTSWISLPNYN